MATSFITIVCPSCGLRSSKAPAQLAGRPVRCSRCATRFVAAAGAEAAAPVKAAAPPVIRAEDVPAATVLEAEPEPAATRLETDVPAATALESAAPAAAELERRPAAAPVRAAAPAVSRTPTAFDRAQRGELLLGLYEVVGVLGEGGMGRVYRVRHRSWGLDLAVKAPLPAVLEAAGGADLFEREAETWVNLGLHPHVVTCHYVRRVDGLPLVFAEYVDGGSLHEALGAGRLGSLEAILDVAIQFAWGLHHAHEQGLVHRDVKPANVMLTADGVAKVTDFGLARARPQALSGAAAPAGAAAPGHTLVVAGGGGGTPAYLSPEQARGEPMSRRSDLWSFALCVLELFLGRRSWNLGVAAPEVMRDFRAQGLCAAGRPPMPAELADVVERCFAERPEDRPHDLAEIAGVLRRAFEQSCGRTYQRLEPRGGTGSADALNNRALSLVDLGRAAEAVASWKQALEAQPQHPEATYNSVLAAWAGGELGDAEAARRMEEACASHPGSVRAQQLAARVHAALGRSADAAAALARAAALGGLDEPAQEVASRVPQAPPRTLRGLSGPVAALALAPDGSSVVAGSGSELRVWEAASCQLLRALAVEGGPVRAVVVLQDGRHAVVAAEAAPLSRRELASGRVVQTFERQVGHVTSLALLPGESVVVAGGSDRVVRLYETQSGRCVREMSGHEDAVTAVAAGATCVASASRDGSVRLWSRDDGRLLARLVAPSGRPLALALDESRSRLVVASDDGLVRDWGLNSHQVVRTFVSHTQAVSALALSPDGSRLISGSADRTLRVFAAESQRLLAKQVFEAGVHALAVAGDGTVWAGHGSELSAVAPEPLCLPAPALCRPASASEEEVRAGLFDSRLAEARRSLAEGNLKTAFQLARTARTVSGHERAPTALALWGELSARLPRRGLSAAWEEALVASGREPLLAVAVEPDGQRALAAGFDGTVTLLDVPGRSPLKVLGAHRGPATCVAFAGPKTAVSGGRDHTLRVWDLGGRRSEFVLEGHGETVTSIDASPDGLRAASASADGTLRLWDLPKLSQARLIEGHAAQVSCVRFSADGLLLASAGWDGCARLWDVESGALLGLLEGHEANPSALALHPAGRQLATGCEDGAIRIFDTLNRRLVRRLDGHAAAVSALTFTPDGRFLISASRDATVRAWDLRRGTEIRALNHPSPVLGLALGASASLALSAGQDGSLRLWRLDWDLDPEGAGASAVTAAPTASPATVHGRTTAPAARAASLREDLRRAAPAPARVVPRAVGGVAGQRKKIVLGALALLAIAASALVWYKPAPRLRLSAYMARVLARGPDLIEVAGYSVDGCDYAAALERLQAGNPSASQVACVAASGNAAVVSDVLDAAPLGDADQITALRLQRNAASALSTLGGEALDRLCSRLSDPHDEVRAVAALALGVTRDGAADACVRAELQAGGAGVPAAAAALRHRLGLRLTTVEDGWAAVQQLLGSSEAGARLAGLQLLPMFAGGVSLPEARKLLEDPVEEVAATAARTVAEIEGLQKADALEGDVAR